MRDQGVGRAPLGTGVFAYKRYIMHPSHCKGSRLLGICMHHTPAPGVFSFPVHRSEMYRW